VGRDELVDKARGRVSMGGSRAETFRATAVHDLLHAGGFLVVGALTAATLQTLVPASFLDSVARAGPLAVLAMAGLAVVMAVCSEADAFVAATFVQFSATAKLVFMVVGPAVDVKLVALQVGTFGRQFAYLFVPLTLGVALTCAVVVSTVVVR
jgi:uncharacterized membrane protein YraQ (UPF0718 family)